MVSDSSMLLSMGSLEIQGVTNVPSQTAVSGTGGRVEHETTPASGTLETQSSVAKGIVEQRSAEHASLAQQNIDSFALTNNKSPREADPFSTAGAVFNSRG